MSTILDLIILALWCFTCISIIRSQTKIFKKVCHIEVLLTLWAIDKDLKEMAERAKEKINNKEAEERKQ